jgi:23S rRNA (uracil1939-C5)-methyltransferase
LKRNDILTLSINRLSPDGAGMAEIEGRTVSVPGAIPGDEVIIRVSSVKRHTALVRLEKILSGEVERRDPYCPHFRTCGGCRWQDIPYDVQCRLKADLVKSALGSVKGIEPVEEVPFTPSKDIYYYRNKMEFSFDSLPGSETFTLGLHEAGKFNIVFDVHSCRLQSEMSNQVIDTVRSYAKEKSLSIYGLKSHTGLLRYLVIRNGRNTGEMMVNLVTSGEEFGQADELADLIVEKFPCTASLYLSINRSPGSTAAGQERKLLRGSETIRERIGEYTFSLSPDAFFQTNTAQAENLYDTVREFSGLTGTERLLDLYCGTGTIGIYLAGRTKTVTGIEISEDAVRDARTNAELNEVSNCSFVAGAVEDVLEEGGNDFDVVICDPPRAGIHPRALYDLVQMRIPRMVYVSCNIKALPGDLEKLAMAGYSLKKVRAFDMSPHTPHVETVVLLEI